MSSDTPGLGELDRRLARLEQQQQLRFDALEEQLRRHADRVVWRDTYMADKEADRRRLLTLEDETRWGRRAMLTSVIFPLLVMVVGAVLLMQTGAS